MTSDDRDQLRALRQQQTELQQTLERLNARLQEFESRVAVAGPEVVLPPIPTSEPHFPPIPADIFPDFPPIPTRAAQAATPDFPPVPGLLPQPVLAPSARPSVPPSSYDLHLGRWLLGIGTVCVVLFFICAALWVDFHFDLHDRVGAIGKLAVLGLVSTLATAIGMRLERARDGSHVLTRTFLLAGLGGLYLMLTAAWWSDSLRVISSPLFGGFLLFCWALYVFLHAELRKSEFLAIFAVVLAYLSAALNPDASFALAADFILAAISAAFLLRKGWAAVPTVGVIGTYLALFRRLVIDDDGTLVLDTSRALPFLPYAFYLTVAWFIFTLAVLFTVAPTFRDGKRLVFLSLNNAGFAGLLGFTAYLAGYDAGFIGATLFGTGLLFLILSRFAGFVRVDPVDVMGAYAAQGLALVTLGIILLFTGMTRVVVLLVETFLLGVAGAFAGDRILTISTYVAAFFATVFATWEIMVYAHHPWLFGLGGALIMLINAWSGRGEVRHSTLARSSIVLSTTCFCVLAVALIFAALASGFSDAMLPPALAIAALILTFAVYQFSILELPAFAQLLLLAALALILFPVETGESLPGWSIDWVVVITFLLLAWWSRQRMLLTGPWKIPLLLVYSSALVALMAHAVHPWFDAQSWIVIAALLSLGFAIFGAATRIWGLAAAGQILLAISLYHVFFPPSHDVFPWTWWAAAIPVAVVFSIGQWVRGFGAIWDPWREPFHYLFSIYRIIAVLGLARWVFAFVPLVERAPALFFLGALILSISVRRASRFGVRCSYLLSALGLVVYFARIDLDVPTGLCGMGILLLLMQPLLLHARQLTTPLESGALIIFASVTGWLFVSTWVEYGPLLTLAWAVYAFFLFLLGLLVREVRFPTCGVLILLATILRVAGHDFWDMSAGFRILSFLLLSLVILMAGFILLHRGRRVL